MNGERYINVLEDHLLPMYAIHQCEIFMQDSAPCHKSKKVMKWLEEHDIRVLDWPGNSPDLNPIENRLNIMKGKLNGCNTSSVPRLKEEIKKLWTSNMDHQYFKNQAESMPRRLSDVIKAKG